MSEAMPEPSVFDGLRPAGLWRHFAAITRIPRPSGREERMAEYVRDWAGRLGYAVREDGAGNLCVHVPAPSGREQAPVVVLQSHLDMVCQREPDTPYDPEQGSIHPVREGDWIRAEGTTLGADNGIGVAAMLHAAESPEVARGPLDLLFTVEEETGLVGAQALDPGLLRGRILLNLDNETDGSLCVGCAGSRYAMLTLRMPRTAVPSGWTGLRVSIGGLRGGHSGMDIDKPRLNANRTLARLLQSVSGSAELRLARFDGGTARNAIPREASATVFVPAGSEEEARTALAEEARALRDQHASSEDGLEVAVESAGPEETAAWTVDDSGRLIGLLTALPCGVLAMSSAIPGLVETSSNVGTVETEGDEVRIGCLLRSSYDPALEEGANTIREAARAAGAEVSDISGYPGWQPDLESRALAVARGTFRGLFDRDPEIMAVHAGLECGIIGERAPGMDMVSFGPAIEGAHAPGERVHVGSTERFWRLLVAILDDLSKDGRAAIGSDDLGASTTS
ncbi:MAG TPA: beta-Ala-His dipeptidase [Longimicrobiaceae bacterium]|nr:beta-Ala-His dipeptidase [Longimicrobiaceae bacterium]